MTKDASFKKVVRRHAEETGQRYAEALTDSGGSEARGWTTSRWRRNCSPISATATASTPSQRRSSVCTGRERRANPLNARHRGSVPCAGPGLRSRCPTVGPIPKLGWR